MRFSKDYSKLSKNIFTTIRKNIGYYHYNSNINKSSVGFIITVKTPTKSFKVKIIEIKYIKKKDITEELAQSDADCSRAELIAMLEKWYGKEFDDFVLLTLQREESK